MTAASDLLNRAVELLRSHAKAAPAGPWVSLDFGDRLIAVRDEAPGFRYLVEEPVDGPTAAYMALMHPPVAMAIAGWLFSVAVDEEWEPETAPRIRERTAALMVARELLREPEVKA
jgi:hypothetical protein